MNPDTLTVVLAWVIVGAPLLTLIVFGFFSLIQRPLGERTEGHLVGWAVTLAFLAALILIAHMTLNNLKNQTVDLGEWILLRDAAGNKIYDFSFKLLFDRLSLPFLLLSLVLCGTIGAFATRYLHREPGYNRFFLLYAIFLVGIVGTSLAGTIETLFTGWELVGLSSALLVAYFQDRPMPARNGLHVWSVYRIADAAFLVAAVVLHHLNGEGDFDSLLGSGPWPNGHASLTSPQALAVGLLLLIAAAGKSALIPFSGWLPRAMEGPTPSSAVFYGALSVHLGAYLLLRVSPIIALSPVLATVIVVLGLATAMTAALAARAQTDIKSALSYASLTQVGLIVAEIGLGLRWIPLLHLIGHASLRTMQFLRAPTLLQDYRNLENAIGSRLPQSSGSWESSLFPARLRHWTYRFALERGYLDALLLNYIVRPFFSIFRWCDAAERRWTNLLSGGISRESDQLKPKQGSVEEFV